MTKVKRSELKAEGLHSLLVLPGGLRLHTFLLRDGTMVSSLCGMRRTLFQEKTVQCTKNTL